jgi:hypothetical protein
VQFSGGHLPEIFHAIKITSEGYDTPNPIRLICEVQQHLGEGRVRTVAMEPTEGLVRGMPAEDLGEQITVPVGPQVLGRVLNVIGEPVDERGPVETEQRFPIHRPAPLLEDQSTELEMFETGIKVIDLLEPYLRGGKIGLFGGAGVGKTVIIMELESDAPISGAFRAAVGDEGSTWVFGFALHVVRVFLNGEEAEVEPPGPVVTGLTVSGGRPVLSLATMVPEVGTDIGKERALPEVPPLAVRLDGDGEWQTWIEREDMDRIGGSFMTMGMTGFETRLAGSDQGRLLYARRYRYDVREYKKSGKLANRLESGEVEMVPLPNEAVERLEEAGRRVDRSHRRPKSMIEGVAWSPAGDALILATAEDGYVLDRWVPALQEHLRLPLEGLEDTSRLQMVATRNGLLFLPAMDATHLLFVPWDFLRDAEWQSLKDDEAAEGSASEEAG